MKIPKIYPITNVELAGRSHAEQVALLTAAGARFIQLREKRIPPRDFLEDARNAVGIAHACGAKIIVNDRVDIALAIGADGVHLGQDDLPPEAARRILGPDAIIGYSTHSVQQALAAIRLPVTYIAAGPAFATSTKENPDDIIGPAGLNGIREAIGDFPLVAIGGIDASNIRQVLNAGADSAAIISGILVPNDSISANFSRLINTVQQL